MDTNSENQNQEGTMDKVHHHMNKNVISRIIVVCISLMLAMSMGYVLYAQLLGQRTSDESPPMEVEVMEEESGYDMENFDANDIESRKELLEYISNQTEEGEAGVAEEDISIEDREEILKSIAEQDESEEGEEISIEDREEILKSIAEQDEEEDESLTELE